MSPRFTGAPKAASSQALIDRTVLALAVLSLAYSVAALGALIFSAAPWFNDAVFALAGICPAVIGSLLVLRRPGNTVGLLLVLIGSTWCLAEASRIYLWLEIHNGTLPASDLAAWFVAWAFGPAFMLIPFLVVVFPNGSVSAGWLRRLLRVAAVAAGALVLASWVSPADLGAYGSYLEGRTNPWAIDSLDPEGRVGEATELVMLLPVAALFVIAPIDILVRWNRSEGVVRLQMRSLALGVFIAVVLFFGSLAVGELDVPQIVENSMIFAAISAMPVAIGVAVARYRLYDIDRIINRALVYALLTSTLAVAYLGGVVALQSLLKTLSGGNDLAIAFTTLVVAALFLPARQHIQRIVDRRFNRRAYDAAITIDAFSRRLRDQIDMDTLRYELLTVVDESMQPSRMMLVWTKGTGSD